MIKANLTNAEDLHMTFFTVEKNNLSNHGIYLFTKNIT